MSAGVKLATVLAVIGIGHAGLAQEAPPFAAFSGASEAEFFDPHDITIGPDGFLWVADKFGDRIARVDPDTLLITETFGDGRFLGVHDISFGPDGSVIVAVTGLGQAQVFEPPASLDANPTYVIRAPRTEGALAHTNGRIYVMATGLGVLGAFENRQMIASATGHSGAHDVAEGADGSVWVADTGHARILRYSADLELLQTIDQPEFGLLGPRYLAATPAGQLLIADQDTHRVLLVDPDADGGPALLGAIGTGQPGIGPGWLDDPEGIATDGTHFYISDSDNNRIVRYTILLN